MALKVTCGKCGGVLHAPEDAGGKKGKCPNCGNILPIPIDAPRVSDAGMSAPDSNIPPNPFGNLPATAAMSNPVPRPSETRGFGSTMPVPASSMGRTAAATPNPAPIPNNPFAGAPAEKGAKASSMMGGTPAPGTAPSAKGWLKARSALGMIRMGLLFITLGAVTLAGVTLADAFGINLPQNDPGYLKLEGLPQSAEITIAAGVVPFTLGLFLVLLGRVGFTALPKQSYSKGPAYLSAFATLLKFGGFLAFAVMCGIMLKEGTIPKIKQGYSPFMPMDSLPGQVQRIGVMLFFIGGIFAESWFFSCLGRIGANLKHAGAASRATAACFILGVVPIVLVVAYFIMQFYAATEIRNAWDTWGKLSTNKQLGYVCGTFAGLTLLGFILYAMAIGAARAALAEAANRAKA